MTPEYVQQPLESIEPPMESGLGEAPLAVNEAGAFDAFFDQPGAGDPFTEAVPQVSVEQSGAHASALAEDGLDEAPMMEQPVEVLDGFEVPTDALPTESM